MESISKEKTDKIKVVKVFMIPFLLYGFLDAIFILKDYYIAIGIVIFFAIFTSDFIIKNITNKSSFTFDALKEQFIKNYHKENFTAKNILSMIGAIISAIITSLLHIKSGINFIGELALFFIIIVFYYLIALNFNVSLIKETIIKHKN